MAYANPDDQRRWARESYARRYHLRAAEIQEAARKRRASNPARAMLNRVKHRATAEGLEFNLELSDLVIPTHCPALGIPLKVGQGRQADASPSLDRIDPAKGYIKGNVVVISFLANRIKSNGTAQQVRQVADWMETL